VTQPDPIPVAGRRVLVVGLGRRGGGEGVVRYLASQGAVLTVADAASEDALAEPLGRLADLDGITYELGSPAPPDPAGFDLVVRNPAVPHEAPVLRAARAAGVPIHTEASVFVQDWPGRIVGITGSKGKTSTAFFAFHLLGGAAAGTFLAGNMGGSALDDIGSAGADSTAVFEFSSFQTETLGERGLAVDVACLTSLHPDHQDRYATPQEYFEAKAPLFRLLADDAWRVHEPASQLPEGFLDGATGRWFCVGSDDPDADASIWEEERDVVVRLEGWETTLVERADVDVEGGHRLQNALVAAAAALACGVDPITLRDRLRDLPTVPHRMEPVPVPGTRRWINDTAATNPTAAAAGIRAMSAEGSLTVLVGGAPKGLDLSPLVDALVEERPETVLLPGRESAVIAARLTEAGVAFHGPVESMPEAVRIAKDQTEGSTVLLAPGCSSFDGFVDEFDRGGQFIAEALKANGVQVTEAQEQAFKQSRRGPVALLLDRSSA
jgi:UDP-N-acetylmuramoylalanine--D-glutamate ligase